MKLLTGFLIFSFTGLAVFGILLVHPGSAHNLTSCLASLVQGAACPAVGNVLATVNFHFGAVKSFVSAFLVFALILMLAVAFPSFNFGPPFLVAQRQVKFFEINSSFVNKRFRHWLALHENSPAGRHQARI